MADLGWSFFPGYHDSVSSRLSPVATSEAVDDYLKAILTLGGPDETLVSSNALAHYLKVRPPSVTGMIQKLAAHQPSLVIYQKSRGVRLTAAGKRRAWELVRHHRLLELFLHDILKYSWDEVHEEAERLEHFISERFEDRVAAILGNPEVDPHGHSIPDKGEAGNFSQKTALLDWPLEIPGMVSSISDSDASALRQLQQHGIRPGTVLRIRQKVASSSVVVRIDDQERDLRLSAKLAKFLLISSLAESNSTARQSISNIS